MTSVKQRVSATTDGDRDELRPNNPLQADFGASDDDSSIDSDERYLVRLIGS
jgi:hypothetical protein